MSKIWRVVKIITSIFFIFLFLLLFGLVTITLGSDELIVDSKTINQIALVTLLLAIPNSLDQLLNFTMQTKKRFKVDQKCPKCKSLIQYEMEEMQ